MIIPDFKKIWRSPEFAIVCFCLLIFLVLQGIRRCYFLTDDNLSGWLPIAVEFGRRLFEGRDPLINEYLYGGVDLRLDVGILALCNPITLLLSPLALTRFYYWLADATALVHLTLGAVFFFRMSRALQARLDLALNEGASIFLSLSWAFCAYNLCVGPSWINFLANMAALPLLFWGAFHPRAKNSFILLFLGAAYSLFCGHLHPFLYSFAILSVMIAAVSFHEKRPALMVRWLGVHLLVIGLALPILLPGFLNVIHSVRAEIVTSADTADINMVAPVLATSLLAGPVTLLSLNRLEMFQMAPGWAAGTAFSTASICFLAVLLGLGPGKRKTLFWIVGLTLAAWIWQPGAFVLVLIPFGIVLFLGLWGSLRDKKSGFYEKLTVFLMLGLFLLIHRPDFLTAVIAKIPIYKMLHWPFREILQLVFFMHVFLCFRMGSLSERNLQRCGFLGVVMMLTLPVFGSGGGTLNAMEMDRKLVISRRAELWWDENRKISGEERWLPVIDHEDVDQLVFNTPFSLLGAYNYPSLYRVKSSVGYWGSWIPVQGKLGGVEPYHWSGILTLEDFEKLNKTNKFQYVQIKVLEDSRVKVQAFGEKGGNVMFINPEEPEK